MNRTSLWTDSSPPPEACSPTAAVRCSTPKRLGSGGPGRLRGGLRHQHTPESPVLFTPSSLEGAHVCRVPSALLLPSPGKMALGSSTWVRAVRSFQKLAMNSLLSGRGRVGMGSASHHQSRRVPKTHWDHSRAGPPDAKTQRQRMVPRRGWSRALGQMESPAEDRTQHARVLLGRPSPPPTGTRQEHLGDGQQPLG